MNRDDYMNGTVDHQTFYCAVADAIGRKVVEHLVLRVAPLDRIREALTTDEHLNNIPLARWDSQHDILRQHVTHKEVMPISWSARSPLQPGMICWSLSDTVCTLKAAARRMAEETTNV
jgi:hypothetical protein